MAVDLSAHYTNPTDATTTSWPKCYLCTEKLARMPRLDRMQRGISIPYPVEIFGIAGLERPTQLHDKYRLIVEVECHGDKMRFVVETRTAEGRASEIVKMGRYYAFVPTGRGAHGVKRWMGPRRGLA